MLKQTFVMTSGRPRAAFVLLLLCLTLFCSATPSGAQAPAATQSERDRAIQLVNQSKFAEALPLFEKLAAANPSDAQVTYGLGITLLMTSKDIKDDEARRQARLRARTALLHAKELGVADANLDLLLKSIAPDGGEPGVSKNKEAQAAMNEAFKAFAAQDYTKAAEAYERAARLDPTLYEAALYTGNTHYALKNWDKAAEWFTKAIAIDPDRETAHRYWGDALMLSGKMEAARDKFLDAIIAEPYNQLSWKGLVQWAERAQVRLAHPKIDVPTNVSSGGNGNTNITIDERALSNKDDGSFAWMMYGITRASWAPDKTGKMSEKFARAYPNEKVYRHSLAEEVDALSLVVTSVKEGDKAKQLQPSLAALVKLHNAGLLDSYILLARADQGVARDYFDYRKANRDKLRRYLMDYVLKGGGM